MPEGMPTAIIFLSCVPSILKFLNESFVSSLFLQSKTKIAIADINCAKTVAVATPNISKLKTVTKIMFNKTFKIPEIDKIINGLLVSPFALKIAAPKLYKY